MIKESVSYTNSQGVPVNTQYCDRLFYDHPPTQQEIDNDKAARIAAWVAVVSAPPPTDPPAVVNIVCEDGSTIQL